MERNRGKGAAVRHGLRHADGALVGVVDADLEWDPADLRPLILSTAEARGRAAIGTRKAEPGQRRRYALGNRLLSTAAGLALGL